MPLTFEQKRIIESTMRGLKATDAEEVIVDVGQILKVIPLQRVEQEKLFYFIVETEEVIITKQKPNSVIPPEHAIKRAGMGHVKREHLLELLEEYKELLSKPSPQEIKYTPGAVVRQPIEPLGPGINFEQESVPIEQIPHQPFPAKLDE